MTYTGPDLESIMGDLDGTCMAVLGDSVRYRPAGGVFADRKGYVEYPEALRDLENGRAIEQDIMVQLLKADVPAKPGSQCRITLGRLPGMLFKPVNVRSDRSGTHWEFEVVSVDV